MSSNELLTESLVRSSLGGWTGSSIRSILPGAPRSATFWLCLTVELSGPARLLSTQKRVLAGSAPAICYAPLAAAIQHGQDSIHHTCHWDDRPK